MEEARHKIVYTLLFYLHKAQKERKLTHAVSNQNIGYHCVWWWERMRVTERKCFWLLEIFVS